MCGIGGYVGPAGGLSEELLLQRLRHRGPDHEGAARLRAGDGTPVWLGFRRLAIIDLSPAGNQPMATEDGAATLVFNGEAYNFKALRQELIGRGHRFVSSGDSEVVLRGYREWGLGVAERLRGMFAFAVWDAAEQRLVLCRDRLGIKPLYYHYDGRRLCFASELRALLHSGAVAGRIDPLGLHGYLSLGSVPQPGTILREVALLLPGHLLVSPVRGGPLRPEIVRYFSLPAPAPPERLAELVGSAQRSAAPSMEAAGPAAGPGVLRGVVTGQIAEVLQEAVTLRLQADVPVGVLLSGGIDSAAVAVLASRAQQALETFTLSYGQDDARSEGTEADALAQTLGTQHHEGLESDHSLLARVPAYMQAVDQPSADGCNTYLVAELVRRAGLKVALSGLGGDEVFLGYGLERPFGLLLRAGRLLGRRAASAPDRMGAALRLLRRLPGLSPRVHKGLALALSLGEGREPAAQGAAVYAALRGLFVGPQIQALLQPDLGLSDLQPAAHVRTSRTAEELAGLSPDALLTYLEVDNYLSNTLLRDADVMSMVHGVELRVPLCDHLLVSQAISLGSELRVVRGRNKPLLVDACGSTLVEHAAARKKRGFVLPISAWLRRGLSEHVSALLGDAALVRQAGLSPAAVWALWSRHRDGRTDHAAWRVWALFTLLSWVQENRVSL